MIKRLIKPATKRHVVIFDEDWQYLDERFGLSSTYAGGISSAVRTIIHAHVKRLRQLERNVADSKVPSPPTVKNEVEMLDD